MCPCPCMSYFFGGGVRPRADGAPWLGVKSEPQPQTKLQLWQPWILNALCRAVGWIPIPALPRCCWSPCIPGELSCLTFKVRERLCFLLVVQWVKDQHCRCNSPGHYCGTSSVSGPGTSACCLCPPRPRNLWEMKNLFNFEPKSNCSHLLKDTLSNN